MCTVNTIELNHAIVGINTVLAPLYISEISPVNYRGAFGALHQFTITSTILLSEVLGINVVIIN